MSSRRILIAGLSSPIGGRLAQALEREPAVQSIVGIDTEDPQHELQRCEFVRVGIEPGVLRRILSAAAIDTVIDTRLITDPLQSSISHAHEVNVVRTRAILEAAGHEDSPVRKLVFKSSADYYGCGPGDPAFFTEEMARRRAPQTAIERHVVEAESALREFATRHRDVTATILRVAQEIPAADPNAGPGGGAQSLLTLPVVPSMLGFDPRFQFVHEDDVVGALSFAAKTDLPGIHNVAGDGVLVLSEVAALLGKAMLPLIPPFGTAFTAAQLRRLGLRVPLETLRQLRYGRGLDNRRLKAAGYAYRYTSREAVLRLRARQRLRPLLESGGGDYRYDPEVEEFLRWSPSVQSAETRGAPTQRHELLDGYDRLSDAELIELISSLEPEALTTLRGYEASHQARGSVLDALDRTLERKRPGPGSA